MRRSRDALARLEHPYWWNGAGRDCPRDVPSALPKGPGGPAGALPNFSLTPSVTNANGAWTFGQGIAQGAVPSGLYLTVANGASHWQVEPRNVWPDGSLKYCVVSAISNMVANQSLPITFGTSPNAPSGQFVSEPTIAAGQYVVTLSPGSGSFPISGTKSFDLSAVIGAQTTWSTSVITKTLTISGSAMSEFHYVYPTGFGQLLLLFRLRVYSNGLIEVELGSHNGFWQAASPGEVDYNISIVINGITAFSQANIVHIAHTRAWRVDWLQNTNGASVPLHDFTYLRAAKLLPNYGYLNPDAATLASWKQKTANLASWFTTTTAAGGEVFYGDITTGLNAGGADPHIGPMPRWEALLCTTGNAAMYACVIGNTRQWGAFGQHFLDEKTGLVPIYLNYPTHSVYRGPYPLPPTATGAVPPGTDGPGFGASHCPGIGTLAYILEGRLSHLEEAQFTAWVNIQDWSATWTQNKGIMQPMAGQVRGYAWQFNLMGRSAAWSPTSLGSGAPPAAHVALRNSFVTSIINTCSFLKSTYIDGTTFVTGSNSGVNNIGWVGGYSANDPLGPYDGDGQYHVSMTAGSPLVTLTSGTISALQGYTVNNSVAGYGISTGTTGVPAGATIAASVNATSSFTMSANALTTESGLIFIPFNPLVWQEGAWMYSFVGNVYGLIAELQPEGVNQLELLTMRNFSFQENLIRFQGPTTDYNITYDYRRAIVYDFPYLLNGSDPAKPQYIATNQANYGAIYNQFTTMYGLNDANLTATGFKTHPGVQGDTDIPTVSNANGFSDQGYGALHASVVAQAREAALPKTDAKWNLILGSSSFAPVSQGANDNPELSYIPRPFTPPAWYTAILPGTWGSPPNSILTGSAAQLFGCVQGHWNDNDGNPINAWGGGFVNYVGFTDHTGQQFPGVHFFAGPGGGHVDYAGDEMYGYGPWRDTAPQWRCPKAATSPPVYGSVLPGPNLSPPGTGIDANGNHSAFHSYNGAVYLPVHNELFMSGFLFTMSAECTGSINGTVLTVTNIPLNQNILGPGIGTGSAVGFAPGTVITSNGTGTGGLGTYNVTPSQTVASSPFTATYNGNTGPDPSWPTTLTFPFNNTVPGWTTKTPLIIGANWYAGDCSCYDPLNHCVWVINPYSNGNRSGRMLKYDLITNTVSISSTQNWSNFGFQNCVCAYDDFYGIVAVWRGTTGAGSFEVLFWQPSLGINAAPWNPATDTNPWTGTPPTQDRGFGSIDYDRRLKQFVVWNNEGATLHTLKAGAGSPYQGGSAWNWTTITPTGGLTPTAENGTGTYRRFAVIDDPDMPGYILMNRVGDPLFVYRPAN